MGENIIIDFNAFHHSNHLRLLICYTGHFDEKKTVEFVSVAICVRSYRSNTVGLVIIISALFGSFKNLPALKDSMGIFVIIHLRNMS